jgi:phosphoserine phosphatase RsbU/P
VLSVGLVMASRFYQAAVERAGSERELMLARRIQESFLLSEFPRRSRLEVYATNVSSKEVSGDFYDVVPVGDDGYLLAVADVSGKGVPAALLTAMLQASLRTQANAGVRVSAMMETINRLVCGRAATGQFATFFLASVSERDMTLRFTNAGHNFPYLFRASGERKSLETGGLVVGMMEEARYQEECVALAPGDRVVFYTDGVTEAARPDQEMFGEERLIHLVESLPRDLAAREVVDRVLKGVREFLGDTEAGDDITVMVLRVIA